MPGAPAPAIDIPIEPAMIDNVIHLHNHRRRTSEGNERSQLIRNRNIKKLREIENNKASGKKGLVFKEQDRIQAALVNGDLIAKAKAAGITAKAIGAGFGGRFHRYSIDTVADRHITSTTSARGLMQKVSGYLKLAGLLAEMLGQDADDIKIAVLEKTTLWGKFDSTVTKNPVEQEAASEVSALIRSMVQHVIRSTGLADLLGDARRIPGIWDRTSYRFVPGISPVLAQPAYLEYWAADDEVPPLPGVALARLLHAEAKTTLLINRQGDVNPSFDELSIRDRFDEEELQATVRMYREIRLVVGPVTSAEVLGPMFESRPHLEITIGPHNEALGANPTQVYPPQADLWFLEHGITSIKLDGVWRRTKVKEPLYPEISDVELVNQALTGQRFEHPRYWEHAPLSYDKNCFETYYTSWTPVDEGHVLYWLDRSPCGPFVLNLVAEPDDSASNTETWFLNQTLARSIEIALATGSLEAALVEDCGRIRLALVQRKREWRESLEQSKAVQFARWNVPEGQE
jgi:hypothetical protein